MELSSKGLAAHRDDRAGVAEVAKYGVSGSD
jgi:hypothetical protein